MIVEGTIAVVMLVAVFLILFYRDPKRRIPSGNVIVSPADGKIIGIIPYDRETSVNKGNKGIIKNASEGGPKKGVIVAIFMRLWDVHINRAPVEGNVLFIRHTSGRFHTAQLIRAENEKNEILIKHKTLGNVKVIQVAGFIARRIVCFVKQGQTIKKGQRLGKIVLGSQVLLVLPLKADIAVKKGDFVKAGETVVARY